MLHLLGMASALHLVVGVNVIGASIGIPRAEYDMPRVISAERAVTLIKNGATLGTVVLLLAGFAEEFAIAIEKKFLEAGHPANLTGIFSSRNPLCCGELLDNLPQR